MKLCECGCGQPTKVAVKSRPSVAKDQPQKFIHGHNPRKRTRWLEEDCGYVTPCWVWQLQLSWNGYAVEWHSAAGKRKHVRAHRTIYEQRVGRVPEGLDLDHLCRNRACVNPEHLEPVTRRENVLRGASVAALNALKTHCPRGHVYDEANTIHVQGGRRCRACVNARKRAAYRKAAA